MDAEKEKQERKRDRIEERSAREEDSMQIGSKECLQIMFEMMERRKEELDKFESLANESDKRRNVRLTEKEIKGERKILTKSSKERV